MFSPKDIKAEGYFPLNLKRPGGRVEAVLAFAKTTHFQTVKNNHSKWMHPREREYLKSIKFLKRQISYVVGRYSAKVAAGMILKEKDHHRIEIASGIFENPIIRHHSFIIPELTLTHNQDLAISIASASGHVVGIDIERVDFSRIKIYERQLTARELTIAGKFGDNCPLIMNIMWTIKESLSKGIRSGLTTPFKVFEIKEFNPKGDGYLCYFSNFGQYKCYSYLIANFILSISLPWKTNLIFDQTLFL